MNTNNKIAGLLSIFCMVLTSCAQMPKDSGNSNDESSAGGTSVYDNIQSSLNEHNEKKVAFTTNELPSDVADALLPQSSVNLPVGKISKIEPRFDISVNRVYARSFFISLTKDTPYSMVVHPDVQGKSP